MGVREGMETVNADELQWSGGSGHRDTSILFKDLFVGDAGQPGNYWLALVRAETYQAPIHRHNFDQIRYMLDGGFAFGSEVQEEGTIGYFTAGIPYTQRAIGPNVHLLLQCEGGNAARFLSRGQIDQAVSALAQTGEFAGGKYRPNCGDPPKDGFEAVWEHVVGEPVAYPEPRFLRPVIMQPDAFAWREDEHQPGVAWKPIGQFNERCLGVKFLRISAGAQATLPPEEITRLFFAIRGQGKLHDAAHATDHQWGANAALRLQPGEEATIIGDADSVLLSLDLPR